MSQADQLAFRWFKNKIKKTHYLNCHSGAAEAVYSEGRSACFPLRVPHLFPEISASQHRNPITADPLADQRRVDHISDQQGSSPTRGGFARASTRVRALPSAAMTRQRRGEESRPPSSIGHVVHGKGTIAAFKTRFILILLYFGISTANTQ